MIRAVETEKQEFGIDVSFFCLCPWGLEEVRLRSVCIYQDEVDV